jgi:diguanylate cyclase (GGDEF)-like protein
MNGLHLILLCGVILAAVVVLILRHEWDWSKPALRLSKLLEQIRAGEIPIDSIIENNTRGLRPLAEQIQGLLHDLRQQKMIIAEMNAEMSQRVANRTDALERKLGSLRQQAIRDPLTGLCNRRELDQQLPAMIEACLKSSLDLAVLMIDVDYFKQLNDSLGHAAGDRLLKDIGRIITSSIREHDAAFRCGGDEFVIVLPGSQLEAAQAMAARLDGLVAALTTTFKLAKQARLSIGVCCLSEIKDATPHVLLHIADKRLYEVKNNRGGRDRHPITSPAAA